ncbi:sulfotransferase [Undibacterium sp. Jales W-56]|uniref:sulfotransferase family protein n=1 Tax=Undibacterium sp. Jales W-56 TaxID=2897325 RepID=UPI0021D2756B|nr:sulfotransferase [Undibacterium sp. Jales W-56]MCU6434887.1 sulfotransferase [Undibacterium sp. Jales W-56]
MTTATLLAFRPKPVLMIPLRRCGSHALRLRLNNSKEFYSPYPLHIVDFIPLVPRYGDLSDDRAYFQLIVDVIGLQSASMVKWKNIVFDPVEIFEALRNQKRSVHKILWELLLRAGEQHQATVVMDKSLDSVHYAEELFELFPDMLLLNVVRDPRAQVASMNRAIIHDYDSALNALSWLEAHQVARSLISDYPEKVLTIRYEDFLSNQESVLKSICHFFGIAFLPEMLDIGQSNEAQKISRLSALWESNCFPPVMANIDKFKQQLTIDEIKIIETLTKDFMKLYGYELMTDANLDISNHSWMQARENSAKAKDQAWNTLKNDNYKDYVLRRFRVDYLSGLSNRLPDHSTTNAIR